MANKNPIYYKDLISPDSTIEDLIKALEKLDKEFSTHIANIQNEAKNLEKSLQGVSGATEEGRQKTKKAANDADRLAEAQRKLAAAQDENARKLAELKEQLRQQNQANKNAAKINLYAEGSYNRLSAQYSENKMRLNAMTQAERDAAEASEGLVTKTKELYEKMKQLQEETGKHQLNVGNYENAIKSALGINNKFGESLLAMGRGGDEAKKAMASVKDGTKALGNTLLGLMKNPAFLAIGGFAAAGAGFKFWYDYNAGLVEATKLTQQFTNKQGADLKNFRVEVQSVAKAFDKDFKEVLVSTNALSKQFGISADKAISIVEKGFIAGADSTEEYLDILKEYPAYFKEAGISADQFVAIISQTVKSGIYSDKGVDAIKEANLRIREMTPATAAALEGLGISAERVQTELLNGSKTTFDIMKEVSAKLDEFPEQSAVVGTAIADIFGGPGEDAGLQYLKTLKDISTDLDVAKKKAGEFGELQEAQLDSTKRLERLTSALFDRTDGGFQRMTTKVKTFAYNTLSDLIEGFIRVTNSVIDLYNNSLPVRILWKEIVINFKTSFAIIGNILSALGDEIVGLGSVIKGAFTLDWDTFTSGIKDFYLAVPRLAKETMKDAKDIVIEEVKDLNEKIEPIEIPIRPKVEDEGGVANGNIGVKTSFDFGKFQEDFKKAFDKNVGKIGQNKLNLADGLNLDFDIDREQMAKFSKELSDSLPQVMEGYQKFLKDENKPKDFYDVLGIDISDEKKAAISQSTEFAKEQINAVMEARVQAAEVAVQKAQEETEAAERNLDRELEARANGYANNVELARKEVEEKKKNERKALKEREKAQKQQAAVQTAMQVSNLITSTSLIWSQLGFPLAIPAVATMWASFAAAKIKAAQVTRAQNEKYAEGTVELLEGGSHASGHDIDLGTKKDGTRRRAEGGEFFAVINKRNSRKYRHEIPSIINALNKGTFPQNYMQAFGDGENLNINVTHHDADLSKLSDDVHAILEQGDRRTYTDYDGARVIEYKNLTRRIR